MVFENLKEIKIEECRSLTLGTLYNIWRRNHNVMLDYVLSEEIPFFGLHGTTEEGITGILKDGKSEIINLATFYDKVRDEFRLYQFYAMCAYVSNFTRKEGMGHHQGKVMVFNLEKNERNPTMDYKYLAGTGGLDWDLTLDTETEAEYLRKLKDEKQRLRRTMQGFRSIDSFEKSYLGAIDVSRLRKTKEGEEMDEFAKSIILRRIDSQYDLAKVFDLVSGRK